jgi:hypothetical protein
MSGSLPATSAEWQLMHRCIVARDMKALAIQEARS